MKCQAETSSSLPFAHARSDSFLQAMSTFEPQIVVNDNFLSILASALKFTSLSIYH